MREIETKIVDFDEEKVKANLKKSEAKYLGEHFFKRWVFDLTKNKGEDEFIRIRTDGKKTTLAYKFRKGTGLENTEELEVNIDNFDVTAKIVSKLVKDGYYQENKTSEWDYKNVQITINRWPKIPPVIEVEGESAEKVKQAIENIPILGKDVGNLGWENLYKNYGLDLHEFKILKF